MQLLSGGNHDIDVDDLKHNTRYTGGFSEGSRAVKIFWEVLNTEWKLNELIFLIGVFMFIFSYAFMLPV